ncbi:Crp/Fnr family transcriptional regulator [Streptomyces sp. INA 01156]
MGDGHDHRLHFVQTVRLFADLPEAAQHRVASAAVTRPYQRDERIYGPGDRTGLFLVHRGLVKVYRLTESGNEQLIRLMSPGTSSARPRFSRTRPPITSRSRSSRVSSV